MLLIPPKSKLHSWNHSERETVFKIVTNGGKKKYVLSSHP